MNDYGSSMNQVLRQMSWDDVHTFLAAVRSPNLREASAQLGVSHPTASRRIRALEETLGLQLFERRPTGLHPTPEALKIAVAAEEVERAMHTLGRVAMAADPALRGPIRVTLPLAFALDLLMPDFHAFQQRWPEVELEIEATSSMSNLAAREADVAIRTMRFSKTPDDSLVGRMAAVVSTAAYGSGDCWLGPRAQWEGALPPELGTLPIRGDYPGVVLKRAAAQSGLGYAVLPCFFADDVVPRVTEPKEVGNVWVLVHPDLRHNPRLRIFRDFMVDALRRHRARLAGTPGRA